MKRAEISLPYYKQGDDLSSNIANSNSLIEALKAHSEDMKSASLMLEQIAEIVSKDVGNVQIDADTHMIMISGPNEIIDELIENNLAHVVDWGFEDEGEYFEDEESDNENWQKEGF